mgnify:FL=1|tara:strand:+ start:1427 stop:1870 length:444 start_codon:yes stop_codon:yes gene_type:complete
MRTVEYRQRIDVPLELVWTTVADFGSLLRWLPGNEDGTLTLNGEGIGMTRDLNLPTVGEVQHRLDALDPERHLLTYTLTRGRPLGMAAYSVTLSLASDHEQCNLHWQGEFDPQGGADADTMAKNLAGAYQNMSEGLESLLGNWRDQS